MANLLVRNRDPKVISILKRRAAKYGRGTKAEYPEVLKQALLGSRQKSFAEALTLMPNVGKDKDFER